MLMARIYRTGKPKLPQSLQT